MSTPQKPHQFIWYDLYGSFFDWEKGFPRTLFELFAHPGKVVSDYVKGEKHYVNPFRLFLVFGALSVFVSTIINLEQIQADHLQEAFSQLEEGFREGLSFAGTLNQENEKGLSPDQQEEFMKYVRKGFNQFNHVLIQFSALIGLFISIPLLSVLTKAFFRKSGHPFAVHFAFNTYSMAISQLFMVVLFIPIIILGRFNEAQLAFIIVSAIYGLWIGKEYFNESWGKMIFKTLMIQAIYLLFFGILTNIVVMVILPILGLINSRL